MAGVDPMRTVTHSPMKHYLAFLLLLFLSTSFADADLEKDQRSLKEKALFDRFHFDSSSQLHLDLEEHYLSAQRDSAWSPQARTGLSEWFQAKNEEDEVLVDCVEDMCVVDFFVPNRRFIREYRDMAGEWEQQEPVGFLKESFIFKSADEHFRLFVFRDTFVPDAL
jgi:hypothetical protein